VVQRLVKTRLDRCLVPFKALNRPFAYRVVGLRHKLCNRFESANSRSDG